MRRTRAAIGRDNRLIGEAFENIVEKWHTMAGLRGALVHVVHNAPPSKFVNGKLIYEEAGVADFTGVLHGGGYLAAEAKSVAPGKRLEKSRISTKQLAHLDAVNAAGGNSLAFLLVEFRVANSIAHRRYAIPWHQVPWKVIRTAESLDERDIAAWYQVPAGTDYLLRYHAGSDARYIIGGKVKHLYSRE
jgi:penicillin-binding protein-related factor A (putative recombinase)